MNNNNSNGSFVNGFLWGAIIGAGVVFLLGTKKGKKLLKTIKEEGLEGASGLRDLVEEYGTEEEYEEKDVAKKQKTDKLNGERKQEESPMSKIAQNLGGQAKRFFKGIPKRR